MHIDLGESIRKLLIKIKDIQEIVFENDMNNNKMLNRILN